MSQLGKICQNSICWTLFHANVLGFLILLPQSYGPTFFSTSCLSCSKFKIVKYRYAIRSPNSHVRYAIRSPNCPYFPAATPLSTVDVYTVHTAGVRVYSKWTFNNLFEQVPERYLTLYIYHYTRTMFAYSVIQLVLTSHCPVFQTLRGVTSSQTLRGVTRTYLDDILYINYHCPLFQIIREVVHTTTTWAITSHCPLFQTQRGMTRTTTTWVEKSLSGASWWRRTSSPSSSSTTTSSQSGMLSYHDLKFH